MRVPGARRAGGGAVEGRPHREPPRPRRRDAGLERGAQAHRRRLRPPRRCGARAPRGPPPARPAGRGRSRRPSRPRSVAASIAARSVAASITAEVGRDVVDEGVGHPVRASRGDIGRHFGGRRGIVGAGSSLQAATATAAQSRACGDRGCAHGSPSGAVDRRALAEAALWARRGAGVGVGWKRGGRRGVSGARRATPGFSVRTEPGFRLARGSPAHEWAGYPG